MSLTTPRKGRCGCCRSSELPSFSMTGDAWPTYVLVSGKMLSTVMGAVGQAERRLHHVPPTALIGPNDICD